MYHYELRQMSSTTFLTFSESTISSVELVVGDVLLLPTTGGIMMECDAVLVEGTCVVNESMLTGESVPITKIPVPDEEKEPFYYDLQRQHVVFCGTEIMQGKVQSGEFCKAVVIRTGWRIGQGSAFTILLVLVLYVHSSTR